MNALPDGEGAEHEFVARRREGENAAAAIRRIAGDFDQAAAFEGFECCCERSAIHAEKRRNGRHRRRFGAVERHEQ